LRACAFFGDASQALEMKGGQRIAVQWGNEPARAAKLVRSASMHVKQLSLWHRPTDSDLNSYVIY